MSGGSSCPADRRGIRVNATGAAAAGALRDRWRPATAGIAVTAGTAVTAGALVTADAR
jgi:hypothetical protein